MIIWTSKHGSSSEWTTVIAQRYEHSQNQSHLGNGLSYEATNSLGSYDPDVPQIVDVTLTRHVRVYKSMMLGLCCVK
jgi:hypothetical protein